MMGKAVMLSLGYQERPEEADFSELRRGLYHFYNCARAFPATLDGFKSVYGDFSMWPSTLYEESSPKIYPRRLRQNPALGIYIAETMREGEVHETEILLSGYRNDGNLDFISYAPTGEISS